jgi:hypothetical protein
MIVKLFDAGDLNTRGVCHWLSCFWIAQSRVGGIYNKTQFPDQRTLATAYSGMRRWQDINTHFRLPFSDIFANRALDKEWLADLAIHSSGYGLIVLWGGGMQIRAGSLRTITLGHTVAIRLERDNKQYFDPNIGAFLFDSSLEFRDWIMTNPEGPCVKYSIFQNKPCQFVKV